MKDFDIAIIGSSSIIAREFIAYLELIGQRVLRVTSKILENDNNDTVIWNYKSELPEIVSKCKKIIIFSKFETKKECMIAIRQIRKSISNDQHFYNISSLAVLSEPNSMLSSLIFKGDDYIRMKKITDAIINKNIKNVSTVYPGLLYGNSELGWQKFLNRISEAGIIDGFPDENKISYLIDLNDFSVELHKFVSSSVNKNMIIPQESPKWREILSDRPNLSRKNNAFFDSTIKNLIFNFITSSLLPDSLAIIVFKYLRNKNSSEKNGKNISNELKIEGMTRFYLGAKIKSFN